MIKKVAELIKKDRGLQEKLLSAPISKEALIRSARLTLSPMGIAGSTPERTTK
ncbi:hypothetical protein [Aneurinibacillus aneurinilyticus]|uniref:hypothetical protein n=1 Tax=Aneurinibacillus aneurinilyticus TaxID=1391 RepID=UPI0036700C8A